MPGCESGPSSSTCLLHLKRWESSFAAPGTILAVGSTGVRLSDDPDHHSVFLSRDAGVSWRQILEGPHKVSILGHGDLLAAVHLKTPGSLLYSADDGKKWTTVAVMATKDKGLAVEGIFTHPSHTDLRAFLALSSEARPGVVLASLDLSEALKEPCKLPGTAGATDSDFEKWSPSDANEDAHSIRRPTCVLGVRTYYVRRKHDRVCRTGAIKLPPLDQRRDTPCSCTSADWACDAGYHRSSYTADSPCELLDGTNAPNITQLCAATFSAHVQATRGYARISGNRCSGGVDMSPTSEFCPLNTGFTAMLREVFYSHKAPVYGVLATVLALALLSIQRQRSNAIARGAKGGSARAFRKKYEDSRSFNEEDDDIERELLINGDEKL